MGIIGCELVMAKLVLQSQEVCTSPNVQIPFQEKVQIFVGQELPQQTRPLFLLLQVSHMAGHITSQLHPER